MQETEVKIPLSGSDLHIYGTLRGDYSNPLIVLCHGYGGWMHETLLYNASRYFGEKGFSTLRLSMYGGGEQSRNISDSDVMTHASDMDDVIAYVKDSGNKWVCLVGHSYSGMAIVYSNTQEFDAAVLWDPSHTDAYQTKEAIDNLKRDFVYVDQIKSYVSGLGTGYVYAKTVFDNDYPKSQEVATKFAVKTCVINASWSSEQKKYGKMYADSINADTKHVVIPGSTHPFIEDGVAEKLFLITSDYANGLLNGAK